MKQQYKDLISTVTIDVQPAEERAANRYYKIAMLLKMIAIVSLLFAIVSIIFQWKIKIMAYIIALVMVALYAWHRKRTFARVKKVLLNDCDPEKVLSFCVALMAHSKRNKNWDMHFYNVSKSLYYAGRFEDAQKVLALFPKYCPDNSSRLKYEILCANFAYHEKAEDALLTHCADLVQLAKSLQPKGIMHYLYEEAMQYPVLLKLEREKEYQKVYDMLEQENSSYYQSRLFLVKKNYYMYQMALAMGEEETAMQHREFIVKNGGLLWYRQEVEQRSDNF